MHKRLPVSFFPYALLILAACSSGKKAFERGDYYEAVSKSINRLRQNPDHSKSKQTLQQAYPLALSYFETEANNAIASNEPFRWKRAIQAYNQINAMYEQVRQCPGCLSVIREPKNFYTEIGPLKEKAAEESYNAGIQYLMKGTRADAKQAYFNFVDANGFVSGYKDVMEYLDKAKFEATVKVLVEQIPVPGRYQLSGGFFQDKVESYLHSSYPETGFVKFYTLAEAQNADLPAPDQVLQIQFDDFSVGNVILKEKTEALSKDSVKVGEAKVEGKTVPVYNTVKAKFTTYRKEVLSSGVLSMMIRDAKTNGILATRKFNGEYSWVNTWARFNGDERALTQDQLNLCKQKEVQPPDHQSLFYEFTKPIYNQLTSSIRGFYSSY